MTPPPARAAGPGLGLRPGGRDLPNYSPEGVTRRLARTRALLADLARVPRTGLSSDRRLTLELIRWDAERALERGRFPWLQFPYTPYEYQFQGPASWSR